MRNKLACALALTGALSPLLAQAGPQQMLLLIDMLKENGTLTEIQHQQLKAAMMTEDPAPSSNQPPAQQTPPLSPSEPVDVMVSTQGGSVKAESYDGRSSFQFTAQIAADAAWYDSDITDMGNAAEIRYARIGVEGTLFGPWEYELEIDFAGEDVGLKDAWLGYRTQGDSRFKVGLFKTPFSLEEMTPSAHQTFMERSLINAMTPGRNVGVGFETYGGQWSLAGSIFGEGADDGDDRLDDEGWGGSLRGTWAPVATDTRVLHLGLSSTARTYGGDSDGEAVFRIRTDPESHLVDSKNYLLDTNQYETKKSKYKIQHMEHTTSIGVEAAMVHGPVSLQGEFVRTYVNSEDYMESLDFHGFYVAGSWFLTGESRNYDHTQGRFSRLTPYSNFGWGEGTGAWEMALRYSHLDLDAQDIEGGREWNATVGINWYVNPNIRFMANYIVVNSEPDAAGEEDDPRIIQVRGQYNF